MVATDLEARDKFFAMRYFVDKDYLHRAHQETTSYRERLAKVCPNPRLTSFCNGSVYFPYKDREEVLRKIGMDIQRAH